MPWILPRFASKAACVREEDKRIHFSMYFYRSQPKSREQQKDFITHNSNSWWVKNVKTLKDFVCTHWTYEFTEGHNANTYQTMYFSINGTYLQSKQTEEKLKYLYGHTCTFWHPKRYQRIPILYSLLQKVPVKTYP